MKLSGSHPSWVRGLKLFVHNLLKTLSKSHPSWVRGLKHPLCLQFIRVFNVAPLVGAWIETKEYGICTFSPLSRTPRGCVD